MKYFLLLFIFIPLSCSKDDGTPTPPRDRDDRVTVRDRDPVTPVRDREQERQRLKRNIILESTVDRRYSGVDRFDYSGGRACEDYVDCEKVCDSIMGRGSSRCYRLDRDLVYDIKDALLTLRNINEVDSVNIDAYTFGAILNTDKGVIEDLVEDKMSEGDLKSFLAWVAINDDIAETLANEDRKGGIIKSAFEELGRYQQDSKNDEESGFNTGLIGEDDTFLYLASDESNVHAFSLAHEILKSFCRTNNKECKLNYFCARNKRSRSRSRYFGVSGRQSLCRTSQSTRRRYNQDDICYVHGNAVWGYLYELINDRDIKDSDFDDDDEVINPARCDEHCGSTYRENEKCSVIK